MHCKWIVGNELHQCCYRLQQLRNAKLVEDTYNNIWQRTSPLPDIFFCVQAYLSTKKLTKNKARKNACTGQEKLFKSAGKIFYPYRKTIFQIMETIFQTLENKFHGLENEFHGLENEFQSLENRIHIGLENFSSSMKDFFSSTTTWL